MFGNLWIGGLSSTTAQPISTKADFRSSHSCTARSHLSGIATGLCVFGHILEGHIISYQSLSRVRLFATP